MPCIATARLACDWWLVAIDSDVRGLGTGHLHILEEQNRCLMLSVRRLFPPINHTVLCAQHIYSVALFYPFSDS
jgi:hypothetical protein